MSDKDLIISQLELPELINEARKINASGRLCISPQKLTYLDVDDQYIHRLNPLLPWKGVAKPDYFTEDLIGAHISVIYPEENFQPPEEDLSKEYIFEILGLFSAELKEKKYYVIGIYSPDLTELRRKYGLQEKPQIENKAVNFHITIGVSLVG